MCCKLMKKCCCLVVIAMIAGAVFYFLCGLKGDDMYEEGSFGKKMQDKLLQTPDGVRDTYDVECKKKRKIIEKA